MKNRRRRKGPKKTHRKNYKKSRTQTFDRKFYSKEDIFISRMASILQLPKGEIKHLFYKRSRTTIRLNHLIADPRKTFRFLTQTKGWELQKINGFKDTYFINNADKSVVSKTEEYLNGDFYIQDLASILSVYILDPQEGEKILDMCAAPGSKTTLISAMTDNKASITANDSNLPRIGKLNNVLHQFGSKNVRVTNEDGILIGRVTPDHYDRVLLDAPCSGEGRVYLASSKPLRFWSIKRVKSLVSVQRELLDSAFRALKPGGTLVYSTCTLEPDENEGVVTHLLKTFKNARVESIDFVDGLDVLLTKSIRPGITKWSGKEYHHSLSKSLRTVPSPEMMGFYVVKIGKG
ncbi:RsmB/NOP family class I SAM-dependent RNA methyltransferase [bacterium]|nr:RsmB/NOP family class I SAM-dependent RNA methyltransferase [bacterium]